MTRNTTKRLVPALAAGLLAAPLAHAGVADPAPEQYFPVLLQESLLNGYDFEFVIHTCLEDASITGIYFESGWDAFFSDSPFDRNLRTDPEGAGFIEGGVSPELAGWTASLVSYEVGQGLTGLPAGGTATVAFVVDNDAAFMDIQDAMFTDGFGIGLRVLGLEGDDEQAYVLTNGQQDLCGFLPHDDGDDEGDGGTDGGEGNNGDPSAIPTPSAALLGLAMLGLVGRRRRAA